MVKHKFLEQAIIGLVGSKPGITGMQLLECTANLYLSTGDTQKMDMDDYLQALRGVSCEGLDNCQLRVEWKGTQSRYYLK